MKSVKKTLKKYFIPHPENDHKPHFLREGAVSVTAAIVVILFFASIFGNYAVKNNKHLAAIQAAFLVDLTNEDRADQGLQKLAINDKLISAASMKAGDMADKSYFAHVSPDGKTPWYWIDQAGYPYLYAGENLAVNFYDSEEVEEAWMDSPTHKANILSRNFTEIGIATASGKYKGDNTTFVVQMFGSQKKSVAPVKAAVIETPAPEKVATETTIVKEQSLVASEEPVVLGSEIEPVPNEEDTAASAEAESFMTFTNPEASAEELAEPIVQEVGEKSYTNWFERLLVSPSGVVQSLYTALVAIVIFALVLKIFIEIRLQHPKNIAYGVLLLAVIVVFMHINSSLAEPVLVVAF